MKNKLKIQERLHVFLVAIGHTVLLSETNKVLLNKYTHLNTITYVFIKMLQFFVNIILCNTSHNLKYWREINLK